MSHTTAEFLKMNNSTEKIGERIRLERLKSNMTQSQLAGENVSRNMLSMIESGKATPSVDTLVHIANSLGIPAGLFFAENEKDKALYTKIKTVTKAKELFRVGEFEECSDLCKSEPFDDELISLSAECELMQAEKLMDSLTLKSASEKLNTALALSKRSVYSSCDFEGTVKSYLYFISSVLTSVSVEEIGILSRTPSRISAGKYLFMVILSLIDKGKIEEGQKSASSFPFLAPNEAMFVKAAVLRRTSKVDKALELFLKLYEKDGIGFILKYRTCAELEVCSEMKRDFEMAYYYSKEKQKITELFKK